MMMRRFIQSPVWLFLTVCVLVWDRIALAQAQDDGASDTDSGIAAAAVFPSASPDETGTDMNADETPVAGGTTSDDLRALEARLNAKYEARLAEKTEALEARLFDVESQMEAASLAEINRSLEPRSRFFGFFDLTFNKLVTDEKSYFNGLLYTSPSFMMQNINLYFSSEMSSSLSVLVELRYSFQPNGSIQSYGIGNTEGFKRADTTVSDPYSAEEYHRHSVVIERAYLTWCPRDWFGVIAGRYLTPYGIWNVEHGSPVYIPIRPPFSQTSHYVPLNQTGIQLFGRFFPSSGSGALQYGITLSNGRGPMEEVYDLDDNKAAGLQLKYVRETGAHHLSFGGYGYIGRYTADAVVLQVDDGFNATRAVVEDYMEYLGTLDFLYRNRSLRIQSEFLRRLVRYDTRRYYSPGEDPGIGMGYPPDNVGTAAYLLVAYTLPGPNRRRHVTATPYASMEYIDRNDTQKTGRGLSWLGGVNIKPGTNVTLKVEYYYVYFLEWKMAGTSRNEAFWGVAGQLAVSF
ncbi:MAG: hypothetical protein JXX14_07335 [Deltaproteobacteria bacterium]|nr:hypothetical protein [Deltaproteobacteria bacterium]